MDFALTDDQQLLRDSARTFLTQECTSELVRSHIDDPTAADRLWPHLSEWTPLSDGPLTDLCLFLEEAGAVLLPGPFFTTTALFRPLLRAVGSDPEGWTGTVALAGPDGVWDARSISDDRTRTFVLEADRVDRIAIATPGPGLVVTEPLPARLVESADFSRRLFDLEVPRGAQAATAIDADALAGVVERGTVALAAELVGTARRILEMTVDYAKERVQFDRPIGSFQAVQHKLADVALEVERATAAVYYAAMAHDAADPDRHRATHVAKAAAARAATTAAKDGVQTHGGIGYTWEHDLHLYLRRAYASEALMGPSAWHHDRLAELLFEGGRRRS